MKDLKQANLTDLLDMLSAYTGQYMKMLMQGATKEQFETCREAITQIQIEVEARKTTSDKDNINPPGTGLPYVQDYVS